MLSEAVGGFAVDEMELCYSIPACQSELWAWGLHERAWLFCGLLGDFSMAGIGLVN